MARIQAEDQFEAKVSIIRRMAAFDPTGHWLERGARALDNPHTATGKESLTRLKALEADLAETGPLSDSFWEFKDRIIRKKG